MSVSVSVQARVSASFGENLAKYNIQPVWLSIQNDTDDQLVFLPISMDRDYYSPFEVSFSNSMACYRFQPIERATRIFFDAR